MKMTGENVLETTVQLCLMLLFVGELRLEPKSFPGQGFHLGATFSSYCHQHLRRTQMPCELNIIWDCSVSVVPTPSTSSHGWGLNV